MYLIRSVNKKFSDGESKYWNESLQDWGLRVDATIFCYEQMINYEGWLPVGGEWVKI